MDKTAGVALKNGLTRADVAEVLGLSLSTVRRMEGRTLHPSLGPKDVRLFNPAEVESVRQRMLLENQPSVAPPATQVEDLPPPAPERVSANEAADAPAAHESESPPLPPPGVTAPPAESAPSPPPGVTAPPAEFEGATAAQVFALFGQGKSPVDAIIETRMAPATVEDFYETWLRLQAMDATSDAARSRIDVVAAEVKALGVKVNSLDWYTPTFRNLFDNHAQDLAGLASQLEGLAERVCAIEGNLADPTVRQIAEAAQNVAGDLSVRLAGLERALQPFVQQAQAAGLVRRM
jgi:hypothetical protein